MNILCSAAIRENALFSCRFYRPQENLNKRDCAKKGKEEKTTEKMTREHTAENLGKKKNKNKTKY